MHSTEFNKNLFINRISYGGIDYAARGLTRAAEVAYVWRQLEQVEASGRALMSFKSSPAYCGIGAYYTALAILDGDVCEARRLLEVAIRLAPQPISARAILTLASIDRENEFQLYLDAIKHADSKDIHTYIEAQRGIAIFKSRNGDHRGALETLLGLEGYARNYGSLYLQTILPNSIAVEFDALGDTEAAKNAIAAAERSPLARRYVEIQQTREEIDSRSKRSDVAYVPDYINLDENAERLCGALIHKTITRFQLAAVVRTYKDVTRS